MSGTSGPGGRPAAIVGVADLASPTGRTDLSVRALEVEVIAAALADAGLTLADVDGIACTGGIVGSCELAEYLRIEPTWTDTTMTGGSSFEIMVEHAVEAIAAGTAEVVLVVYADNPRTAVMQAQDAFGGGSRSRELREWEDPYGAGIAAVGYALAASRHMATYGTTREQLAEIAVSTRMWAAHNPMARYRDPITIEDVIASKPLAEPLHRLDCCLYTDGAGAVVVTSLERARDLRQAPVRVLGLGTSHTHGMAISQMPDLTVTPGVTSGRLALGRAGVAIGDVDVLQTYDSFTITVLLALEDLGFCAKGEGGAFVADGRLRPGGVLPTNTNGGGLSFTHPGMFGIFLLVEAARQVRGTAGDRQVPDVEIALAHGTGGLLSCTSTVVLGVDR